LNPKLQQVLQSIKRLKL